MTLACNISLNVENTMFYFIAFSVYIYIYIFIVNIVNLRFLKEFDHSNDSYGFWKRIIACDK